VVIGVPADGAGSPASDAATRAPGAGSDGHAGRGGRSRRTIVALLVALSCVVFTAAVPAVWARRNFLDTSRFVDRVGPTIDDPAVQDALATRITLELMTAIDPRQIFEEALPERGQILAVPLTNALQGFVHDRVVAFLGTDAFGTLWTTAIRSAHASAVRVLEGKSDVLETADGRVTLSLLPIIGAVLRDIADTAPDVLGRDVTVPELTAEDRTEAINRIETALGVDLPEGFGQFTVYDDGRLEGAQRALHLFDRAAFWILPIAIAFGALAIWLSRARRRTILQLSAGAAIGMVLLRRVAFRLDDEVSSLPPTQQGRDATRVVVNAFLDPLTTFAAWMIALALVVVAIALVTGDYAWAVALRRRARDLWAQLGAKPGTAARDEAFVSWIHSHRDALLAIGAVIGVVVLAAADLSWFGLLLVLALVAIYELFVYRVATPPTRSDHA
jgi:hypothetical protein